MRKLWDVIVIGGGHAGIEAAHAAASVGADTLMVTMAVESIGRMSCNPAIGGLAKGHVVVELDALGGIMPRIADRCGIQFRLLNRSKGPAVQAIRAQEDRERYAQTIRSYLFNLPKLQILQGIAEAILIEKGKVRGIKVKSIGELSCRALVVTTGTFLRGLVHVGKEHYASGRANEPAAQGLSESLKALGFTLKRLKTGTSPRVLKASVSFEKLERQDSEEDCPFFSIHTKKRGLPQRPCYITYTTQQTHEIIQKNLHLSAMYSGQIEGIGPRYCPSIEDKVVRFPEKQRHQIFIEPEGLESPEVYLNGLSTNMPFEVQVKMLHSIPGLTHAQIVRPGYAVEYDAIDATQLDHTLQAKAYPGLFFAGQINGTSGYEEAAGQGFVAGVNAALFAQNREPFTLTRKEAYIGVMVDDLVTRGVDEPYRLFTSRAEKRLSLGFQRAYKRLTEKAYRFGLVSEDIHHAIQERESKVRDCFEKVENFILTPSKETQALLQNHGILISQPISLGNLYRKTRKPLKELAEIVGFTYPASVDWERVTYEVLYKPYEEIQDQQHRALEKWKNLPIPAEYDYKNIPGLSREIQERLSQAKPKTLGEAMGIRGITPSAITVLYVHLRSQMPSS